MTAARSLDLLLKGGTYHHDEIVGWELVEGYGGEVKALGEIPDLSTTRIVSQILSMNRGPLRNAG